MTGRLIAMGDIHGCSEALRSLLNAVAPQPEDTIVTLGDYIDRGSDSRGVIEQLLELRTRCRLIPLLGNHEEMLLDVLAGTPPYNWLQFGGSQTLDSYNFSGDLKVIPDEHVEFIQNCLDAWETDSFLFTHGNYLADRSLERQPIKVLRWTSLRDSLPEPHRSGKIAVVGHTANKAGEIVDLGYLRCLDTYCYGGKWLTGMDLNSGKIWQFDKRGNPRA